MLNLKNWKLPVGLGLITSLINDVFYGFMKDLIGMPYDLGRYYSLWMMALSIYLRIAVVVGLLWSWKRYFAQTK
jgi:hypothetical protein